jgi:general secretion pathway protein B
MSYILEALKKADKERRRGKVPDLLTVQDSVLQKPRKRLLWPYLIAAALLVNAGLLVWGLSAWQFKKPALVAQSTAEHPNEAKTLEPANKGTDVRLIVSDQHRLPSKTDSPEVTADEEHPVLEPQNISEKPSNYKQQPGHAQAEAEPEKKVPDKTAPTVDTKKSHEGSPESPNQTPSVSHPEKPELSSSNNNPEPERIYDFNDLPPSIKKELPDFSISSFVYSNDPASRMIKINGQTMREGQVLTEGPKLEEIIQDGVILNYHNYRFRVELK